MKKLTYILVVALLSFSMSLNAQVREQTRNMSQGTESALVIKIPNTDEKLVAEVWQNYIKDAYKGKTKWNRKEKEWLTDNVGITAIGGNNTVDLYTAISKSGQDVELALWCDLGGAFLSSNAHRDRYEEAEKMLMRFSMEVAKAGVQAELDEQEKGLKKLEGELKKLKNENDRYLKDIEKAEAAIRKAKDGIVKNEKDQELVVNSIQNQHKLVDETKKRLKEF